jgi:cytochrome c oxidase subunit IV
MKEPEAHIVPQKTFIKVWLALLALTAITITVAELHLGRFSMLTALAIASFKAGLVLWFFMHLKYESRLFKWLLLAPIVTLAVIIGLTFFDIWYR